MANPDISISPEKLLEIHRIVQKTKSPAGFKYYAHVVKGIVRAIFTGRLSLPFDVLQDVYDAMGLDRVEGYAASAGFDRRLRELGQEDLFKYRPVSLVSGFFTGAVEERGRQGRERFLATLDAWNRKVFREYETETGVSANIARLHASSASGFGSAMAIFLYGNEINIPYVFNLINSWQNTILSSRSNLGYTPVSGKVVLY